VLKAVAAKHNQDKHELMLEIMGQAALGWDGEPFSAEERDICRHWLRTKANSIEGGTSEVMLNVVAKRILDLPGA
jgi:alkylation response protein AidB-like acyl-CoA dehydrogenase